MSAFGGKADITQTSENVRSKMSAATMDYSTLMPANLITFAHFSVSAAISLPNSDGPITIGSAPKAASRASRAGSAKAALVSLLSLSTIAGGVIFGAQSPHQLLVS